MKSEKLQKIRGLKKGVLWNVKNFYMFLQCVKKIEKLLHVDANKFFY